jgi:hypothetical protein
MSLLKSIPVSCEKSRLLELVFGLEPIPQAHALAGRRVPDKFRKRVA